MKWVFHVTILFALLGGCLKGQTGGYKISGRVVDDTTNTPLPKILVQISSTQQRDAAQFAITDSNGSFSFANLSPGKYSLLAGRSDSGMQLYQGEEGFSTAIVVGPELDSEHIVFPLQKPGSISGTILDEEGTGLRGAQVHLYWQHMASGRLEVSGRGMQVTKTSGQFRFGHLQPGTYYLAVQAHPWYAQSYFPSTNAPDAAQNSSSQQFDVAYPLTYYADATDFSSASPITVTKGGTATVQMTLRPVPAVHIRLPDSQRKSGTNFNTSVVALGPNGQKIPMHPFHWSSGDHQELGGIAPGRYEVSIQTFENGRPQTIGAKTMDLQNGSEVDLSSTSRVNISGHITFEGKPRPTDPLTLHLIRPEGGMLVQAPIGADGTFQAQSDTASPGRYRLALSNPEGFHFQSVDAKGGKWINGFLEVPEGANVQLSIIASAGSTALDGVVLRDDKPVPGAMVLLLPENSDRNDLTRRDQSDSDGTFTLPEVVPGRYRVLAIENGHGLAYQDPALIKPYLPLSQVVTVSAGKQPTLKVNVQGRLP
ncbi:MAG: carboxypeptidase regulatory-like domain-containing protein [Acidobacteriaceae bacterium]|nr:carboxypeptidase regulatory-like domain-containing protein [Acidobacteriaceae bacterium]MBV9937828.1 carboxypeptidase regulatory-like domain-containing protein [Acidobacteriaceae bacterium]